MIDFVDTPHSSESQNGLSWKSCIFIQPIISLFLKTFSFACRGPNYLFVNNSKMSWVHGRFNKLPG